MSPVAGISGVLNSAVIAAFAATRTIATIPVKRPGKQKSASAQQCDAREVRLFDNGGVQGAAKSFSRARAFPLFRECSCAAEPDFLSSISS
jgi:hypothetical protein